MSKESREKIKLISIFILLSLFIAELGTRYLSNFFSPTLRVFIQEEALPFGKTALRIAKGTKIILSSQVLNNDYDVIVLGDSMVFGCLVDREEIFTSLIQEETGWRILNLGIAGNAPAGYNRILEYVASGSKKLPSLIIYSIYANDIAAGDIELEKLFILEDDFQADIALQIRFWREKIFHRSRLYQLLKRIITFKSMIGGEYFIPIYYKDEVFEFFFAPPSFWSRYLDLNRQELKEGLKFTLDKTSEAKRFSQQLGADFVVVLMPFKEQIYTPLLTKRGFLSPLAYDEFYDSTYDLILERLKSMEIDVIDMRDVLRKEAAEGKKLYWPLDIHFTSLGQKIIAEFLINEISGKYLNRGEADG